MTGIPKFRKPFASQLRETTTFVLYPNASDDGSRERALERVEKALRRDRRIGAVIVEPIQGRAGIIVPPVGFLTGLRQLCTDLEALLIFDEIYTGFGRTGARFASQHEGVRPDIVCIGKAMANGFPISAAIGTTAVMDAWQPSQGEALHTSTYLGNPMGCAASIATIDEFERLNLAQRAEQLGQMLAHRLLSLKQYGGYVVDVRGRGLMWGIELKDEKLANACVALGLKAGIVLLQSGLRGEVITIAPPLVISDEQIHRALDILSDVVRQAVVYV